MLKLTVYDVYHKDVPPGVRFAEMVVKATKAMERFPDQVKHLHVTEDAEVDNQVVYYPIEFYSHSIEPLIVILVEIYQGCPDSIDDLIEECEEPSVIQTPDGPIEPYGP